LDEFSRQFVFYHTHRSILKQPFDTYFDQLGQKNQGSDGAKDKIAQGDKGVFGGMAVSESEAEHQQNDVQYGTGQPEADHGEDPEDNGQNHRILLFWRRAKKFLYQSLSIKKVTQSNKLFGDKS